VQQNSATAEQSAAASEEMSSQSGVLQQLTAQFKLRGSGGALEGMSHAGRRLPVGRASQNQLAMPETGGYAQSSGAGSFGKY
jgi:hypothetical protein